MSLLFFQQRKKYIPFLVFTLVVMVSCLPIQPVKKPTENASTDCELSWKKDKTDEAKELAFTISLNKHQYKPDDVILSTLSLRNQGATHIWVNERMIVNDPSPEDQGDVYFVILAPWSETAHLMALVDAMGKPETQNFVMLAPGETTEKVSEDIMYYSFSSLPDQVRALGYPVGKYCAWAVYHNQTNPGLDGLVWKGKIKSNFVEFEITE